MKTPNKGQSGSPRKPNIGRGGNRRFRADGTPINSEGRSARGGQRPDRMESRSSEGDSRPARGGSSRFRSEGPSAEGTRRPGTGGPRPYRNDGPSAEGDRRQRPGGQRQYRSDGPSSEGDRRHGPARPRQYRNDGPAGEGDRRPSVPRPGQFRNDGPPSEGSGRPGAGGQRRFRNEGAPVDIDRRGRMDHRRPQDDGDEARGPRPARQRSSGMQIRGDLLYGRNAVRESLRAGKREHRRLFIAEGVREDERINETIELAKSMDVLVERVPRMLLDDLTKGGNHQGVAMESGEFPYTELEDIIAAEGTILIMDHLNDPQNFGTLMRAADAAGIAGIVLPQDRSVSVSPAVVNSSAGAVEHLRVAMTPNLARALDKIEESGRWIVGLDEDETASDIFTTTIPTPVALVLGAEGSGLSPIVRKRCQVILSLPMRGHVDSLNAATAGSIVLYDLLRRELTED